MTICPLDDMIFVKTMEIDSDSIRITSSKVAIGINDRNLKLDYINT